MQNTQLFSREINYLATHNLAPLNFGAFYYFIPEFFKQWMVLFHNSLTFVL